MTASQRFPSSRNIGGVECDFLSREEVGRFLKAITSPPLIHIVTLNAEMVVQAQGNERFKRIIRNAQLVLPDSAGIMWAREYLNASSILGVSSLTPRVFPALSLIKFLFSKHQPLPGVDLIFDICEVIEKNNGIIYLLGGSEYERSQTAEILEKKYPHLHIQIISDQTFSPLQPTTLPVRQAGYNLQPRSAIFVALGSPKQSFWVEEHRKQLEDAGVGIAMGVGGAFAMIAGTLPRAPQWMRTRHIEWLWRLLLEPHRMRRIWNAVVIFPLTIYTQRR